jgi:hypothetical protein
MVTPFVFGPDRLLSCPWENSRRDLDVGQTAIAEVVAKTAATLPATRTEHWHESVSITWIAQDGSVLSHAMAPLTWWRNRLAKYIALEVQRA